MPSPIGHALGGVIAALIVRPTAPAGEGIEPQAAPGATLKLYGALGLVACLPDIDFLWGRHNYETHSLGAAAIAGLVVLAWTRGAGARLALAVTLAWSTHVLFDWLGSDDRAPLGVMALWPLTHEFYYANAWLFDAISRHYWRDDFVSQNVFAILKEVALLGPIALALAWWRRRGGRVG